MREGEWPSVSAPSAPPSGVWYFGALVGDTVQEVYATNFRHTWQLGIFLRAVLDDTEYEIREGEFGEEVRYSVVTERDHRGQPMSIKRFWGKINQQTFQEAFAAADKHGNMELPYNEEVWVRKSRGERTRSHMSWSVGSEPEVAPPPQPSDRPREPVAPREPREPRVARDPDALTVASIAATAGVDPKQVRMELRKRKVEKPAAGWEFADGDPRIAVVNDIIKGLKA